MKRVLLFLFAMLTIFMTTKTWATEQTTFPLTSGQTWINTTTNTKYTVSGTAGNLTLTASVADASVNGGTGTIDDRAFKLANLNGLKSFVVGEGITSIGIYVCYDAENFELTTLSLPASLTTIGHDAFYNCPSITTMTFANGSKLQSIGDDAFRYTGITSIDFTPCTKLESIGERAFQSVPLNCAIDLSRCTQLTSIGQRAFFMSGITSLYLPASLTTLTDDAFYNCPSLTTVTFADGSNLESIGEEAFRVTKLSNINLSACTKLKSIGSSAFFNLPLKCAIDLSGCTQLTSIGQQAFYMDSIPSLHLPASLTSIGSKAFYLCKNLTTVDFASGSQLQYIGNEAFSNTAISSMNLNNCTQLTYIGEKAFYSIPMSGFLDLSGCSQLTSIEKEAFAYCENITGLSLPASLTVIKNRAFMLSVKLTNLTIADGSQLTSIEENAFFGFKVPTIILPCPGLTSIGSGAFGSNSLLKTIVCLTESDIEVSSEVFQIYLDIATVYMLASKKVNWPRALATKPLYTVTAGKGIDDISGTPVYSNYYTEGTTLNISCSLPDPLFFINGHVVNASGSEGNYSITIPSDITDDNLTIEAVQQALSVDYIDASGNEQTVDAKAITGSEESLDSGWYVVSNNVVRTSKYQLNGETHIILADGCSLNIGTADNPIQESAIYGNAPLSIYGQSNHTGQLNVYVDSETLINEVKAIDVYSYQQNGGNVNINATDYEEDATGIYANSLVEINRGTLTVNSDYFGIKVIENTDNHSYLQRGGDVTINARVFGLSSAGGSVDILGGKFSATGTEEYGIYGSIQTVTFGWTSADDHIYANKYNADVLKIADGQYFTDGTKIYSGTITDNIDGKTLRPSPFTSGTGTTDDPWIISNADGWNIFCDCVEDTATWNGFTGKTVKLGADITVTRMAGSTGHEFKGTFDGQGHTLSVNLTDSVQGTAPFCEIKGGTIRNLKVTGSVTGKRHSAGLVGFARGEDSSIVNTIENCHVGTSVFSNDDYAYMGGIVGHGLKCTLIIRGCAFTGTLTSGSNYTGGLQGWSDGNTLILEDDIFAAASVNAAPVGFHPIALHYIGSPTNATVSNVYYTVEPTCTNPNRVATTSATVQPKQVYSITAGDNVTVAASSEGTAYDVSGITIYSTGLMCDSVLYASENDEMALVLGYTGNGVLEGFTASAGTLTGTENPYALTMPAENVVISATTANIPGDVNQDGKVNVNDVTYLINIILNIITEYNFDVANVNGDTQVNVSDVTMLINIILEKI